MSLTIPINRAPVLTLWAAVVAERLGFSHEDALTLGKAVAGLNAQSKGRRLGIYHPAEKPPTPRPKPEPGELIKLLGRAIPVEHTKAGLRAVVKDQTVVPASVQRYLEGKFGAHLSAAQTAMKKLAANYPLEELAGQAFGLYEMFRPEIPAGVKGWGAEGTLDLGVVEKLGRRRQ
jgi:hypothetical protein